MRPQPFHGYIGEGRIPPDKDSLLGSWQDGMGTACDRKSNAGRRNFGRAPLYEKHDGNKAKHRDNQTEGRVYGSHARILFLVSLRNQGLVRHEPRMLDCKT